MIEVFGEGGDGSIDILPKRIDYNIIQVNFKKTQKIVIHNLSHVNFHITLDIQAAKEGTKLDSKIRSQIQKFFDFDFLLLSYDTPYYCVILSNIAWSIYTIFFSLESLNFSCFVVFFIFFSEKKSVDFRLFLKPY